jgi:hypothetical protein
MAPSKGMEDKDNQALVFSKKAGQSFVSPQDESLREERSQMREEH